MQRTVRGTKITYAKVEMVNGEIALEKAVYMSTEKDPTVAVKKFRKVNPTDAVLATEEFSQLYILDDEIFFKYAKVAENTEETTEETTEE